jgi:outer membrane protein assembly factor BamB
MTPTRHVCPSLGACVVALAMGSPGAVHAADWPGFRGPEGSGATAGAALPAVLSRESIAWSVPLPGRGLSGAIVLGDRVFVTCSSGPEQQRLHAVCLDTATGRTLWERQFWATGRTMCHGKTSVAAPTPCTDGDRFYALYSSNDLVCLDRDGTLLWFRGLTADYPNVSNSLGMTSSLVVTEGTVVAQVENDSESYALGIDAATGVNRWRIERPKAANWTSPLLVAPGLVALQSKDGIDVVRAADGGVAWRYDGGAATIPSGCVLDGVLYVPSHGVTALAPPDGEETKPRQLWRSSRLSPGTPSAVASGGRVFALGKADVLTAGSAADGERLWQLRLEGPFSATPVIVGERMVCVSEKGLVQVIDVAGDKGELLATLDLEDEILASPAVVDGAIYVRSNDRLTKITAER